MLAECDQIAESAVVARADEQWGEIPVVAIVLREAGAMGKVQKLRLREILAKAGGSLPI